MLMRTNGLVRSNFQPNEDGLNVKFGRRKTGGREEMQSRPPL